jgi:hypothetical protein
VHLIWSLISIVESMPVQATSIPWKISDRQRNACATWRQPLAQTWPVRNWHRRREIIRTLVQRIDIAPKIIKIILRVTQNTRGSTSESIVITLPRR